MNLVTIVPIDEQGTVLGTTKLTLYVLNFSEGTKNLYLHFMSFLHIGMAEVVEILPQVRQGPTYST